jgi:hypothetical protein
MKPYTRNLILLLISFVPLSSVVMAQDVPEEFVLPVARLGDDYRVEIENVLRDKYRVRVDAGKANAVILWAIASGEMPAGLTVRTDGTIIGNANNANVRSYHFALKAVDMAVRDEPLELRFALEVKAGRLRLTKIEGPRLVPADAPVNAVFNYSSSPLSPATQPKAAEETVVTNGDPPAKVVEPAATAPAPPLPDVRKMAKAEEPDLQNPFSSMNKRFILGVDQTGGASAESKGKPFINLFINTPLINDDGDGARDDDNDGVKDDEVVGAKDDDGAGAKHKAKKLNQLPRVSAWGDVRLTSTPAQVTAFANISSAAVDTITGGEANELVSGFDFVVGPEFRIARFDNITMGLIAAFGAVSPLSPRQSVEIFEVPKEDSSQAEAFFKEFPGAKGKEHIAFISPERDRFLRQYYGGLRFRTYTKDNGEIQNVFPSMLDVTFGQSEAVTGGKLHKFVFGLDGFYVLPFPTDYRFLYLFGSAKFKVGGPKTIKTPFLLDNSASSVKFSDANVFIAEPRQSNRDVYRIGFGVDLFELFRR